MRSRSADPIVQERAYRHPTSTAVLTPPIPIRKATRLHLNGRPKLELPVACRHTLRTTNRTPMPPAQDRTLPYLPPTPPSARPGAADRTGPRTPTHGTRNAPTGVTVVVAGRDSCPSWRSARSSSSPRGITTSSITISEQRAIPTANRPRRPDSLARGAGPRGGAGGTSARRPSSLFPLAERTSRTPAASKTS